ncbi:SAM-dependent methyltransferase [Nocardia sp. NPDC004068]|uniref:SAM-dependent methyltransferase n=1 Tax=Nocardia sp. NPDC004068 TaxID=3364303 RepID=UPI00369021DE
MTSYPPSTTEAMVWNSEFSARVRGGPAHSARIYDYFLGGVENAEIDRHAANQLTQVIPSVGENAKANRAFMHRAVRFAAERGVRQFLDIGTGVPLEPNVHQIAQSVDQTCKVVYVDYDSAVLANPRGLLNSSPEGRTAFIQADVTDPMTILDSAPLRAGVIDLSQPVGLSLIAVMHFIDDDEVARNSVAVLLNALAPGSYMLLSHATPDFAPDEMRAAERCCRKFGVPLRSRTRTQIGRFFEDTHLIEPGLVRVNRWPSLAADPAQGIVDDSIHIVAGVAIKP